MKESVTKFDLESAFKALDELDIPVSEKGIKANRPALTEIFSRKTKFDTLFEEYYDVSDAGDLEEAQEAREAEIAKAKLARIEKIVDLEADSPEDLLTSYVGKYIMQCPQCMTLFYKDQADIVEAEEDPNTVNVNEVCQHCGNESGYTLIGKVGEATPDEVDNFDVEANLADEMPSEDTAEEPAEESEEGADSDVEDLDIDLDALDIEEAPVEEEEKKEESFMTHSGETLVEEIKDDADLDAKLKAHSEYIEYLRNAISDEEAALEKATNDQIKEVIQKRIDAYKEDLEAALPDAVKVETPAEDTEVTEEETIETEETVEETTEETSTEEKVTEALTESLTEGSDLEVSADEFDELINLPEFKKPISDTAVRKMLDTEEKPAEEEELEEGIFDKLNWTRAGKADFILKNALLDYGKIKVDNGKLVPPDSTNRKFETYVIVIYKNTYKEGDPVNSAPDAAQLKYLEAAKKPLERKTYKEADALAKEVSQVNGGGPVVIYLAKSPEDANAVFLCEYFKGKLVYDQVKKYFDAVKKEYDASKALAKAGGFRDGELKDAEPTSESLQLKNSLNTIIEDINDIQETALESLIADSLVETYKNVAGYKLTKCNYINESLQLEGTVYFTSGNNRKITYDFTEAYVEEGKVRLCGKNKKLGENKQFTLIGNIDTNNKTLITESFR